MSGFVKLPLQEKPRVPPSVPGELIQMLFALLVFFVVKNDFFPGNQAAGFTTKGTRNTKDTKAGSGLSAE